MPGFVVILIVVGVAAAIVLGVLGYLAEKKRREAMSLVAAKLGWGFNPRRDRHHDEDRRFHVRSPDKRFAYDVVHPRMMEFLMAGVPGSVDIEYGRCCLSDGRHRWEPGSFETNLDWLRAFFDHWPGHVTRRLA